MPETFIARRWNTGIQRYVDSKNKELLELNDQPLTNSELQEDLSKASQPPQDGSSPFLALPTELRLQIYTYLATYDVNNFDELRKVFDFTRSQYFNSPQNYAYLYRSPGRVTKPNAPSKQILSLFHVCRLMRDELVDCCFGDRTFVLEASLYQDSVAGLNVLPPFVGPTAWVKRLLLITVVELDGRVKGIADLRPIQQMVKLKDLRIVFSARRRCVGRQECTAGEERKDDPISAVMECVPSTAKVYVEDLADVKEEFIAQFGQATTEYLFQFSSDSAFAVDAIKKNMDVLLGNSGKLSGSTVNHSQCGYHSCLESLSCVNSSLRVPCRSTSSVSARISTVPQDGTDDEGLAYIEWVHGV